MQKKQRVIYAVVSVSCTHIQSALCEKTENCHKAIENDPQIAKHIEHPEFDGCVFYTLEGAEGNIHMFEMGDAPLDEHIKRLNDSVRRLKLENKDLKDRRKRVFQSKRL